MRRHPSWFKVALILSLLSVGLPGLSEGPGPASWPLSTALAAPKPRGASRALAWDALVWRPFHLDHQASSPPCPICSSGRRCIFARRQPHVPQAARAKAGSSDCTATPAAHRRRRARRQVAIVGCLPLPGSCWACGRCSEALGRARRA